MITEPMLADKCKDPSKLRFPVLATPKLDGIRCLKINGQAVSRNFKPIRNLYIRTQLEKHCPDGCDGELVIKGAAFNKTSSTVMRMNNEGTSECDFEYWVFDFVPDGNIERPYQERMFGLLLQEMPEFVKKVLPAVCMNLQELEVFEDQCIAEGYEGVMVRSADGPYKCGRSTVKEGYLLKIKRFVDSEGRIIGYREKIHNTNPATENAFGRTERNQEKAGMVPAGVLGSFEIRDLETGEVCSVGSGFTAQQREEYWQNPERFLGQIISYRYQRYGKLNAPRFPVFRGFRHPNDMSKPIGA